MSGSPDFIFSHLHDQESDQGSLLVLDHQYKKYVAWGGGHDGFTWQHVRYRLAMANPSGFPISPTSPGCW